ncbi:MAG: zinc-dependent metalloprotease [Rhodothermales bacterium]
MRRFALLFLLVPFVAHAQDDALPTIEAKTEGLERRDGFVPVYWDARAGKVWLEIERFDDELLYSVALTAGLGSNDVGLDRGQLGGERVVRFERVGPKVLMVQPNLGFRADSESEPERRAVRDAFAESVVWAFDVAAETGDRVLVDATPFVVRDAHGVAARLKATGQGSFSLDAGRSTPYPAVLKAFPDNTELEARLTFTSSEPGRYVRDVAADPEAVTVRVRHSLVRLPDDGYTPRVLDPRSGYFGVAWQDYANPIGEPVTERYIARHRLECAGRPDANGRCAAREPIVYYLDPGTPEPVRSAFLDGARWWAAAFEAAGFRDGYRVEMLPDDADPLDVRYNVIQWVHRATRGWSYGSSVTDPRTGEIIKGHVSLGSLRVRQDYLLAEGLLAPYTDDDAAGFAPDDDPMLALALARLRQLSAHEVGHTLGIAHNFAASTYERSSVMDYPAPLVTLAADGSVDVSEAYAVGVGPWDVQTVRYGYTPFATDAEADGLETILRENRERGLDYLSDADARSPGAAAPAAILWDNFGDPVAALDTEMAVRRTALARFGGAVIRAGQPLATLEEVLVPLYLRHRYQVEGVAKLVGGVTYSYTVRGDGSAPPKSVAGDRQRAALDALLAALDPKELRLPDAALTLIPPRPPGYYDDRERFDRRTGPTLDPVAPAEAVATLVLGLLVDPDRAARLVYQHDFDGSLPGLGAVLGATTEAVFATRTADAYEAELNRTVQTVWVQTLIGLADDRRAASAVRARAEHHLRTIHGLLGTPSSDNEATAHGRWLRAGIQRFLDRSANEASEPAPLRIPPGSPIGH